MAWEFRTGPRLLAAVVLGVSGLVLLSCERNPEPAPVAQATSPASPPEISVPPLPPPPVGRAELLQAIDSARSAYAAGHADPGSRLTGRQFAIRQAFGCRGASESDGAAHASANAGLAHWTWGPDRATIEISLAPVEWTGAPFLGTAESGWEAVEGYWLARPWQRTDDCPAAPAQIPPEEATAATKGAEPPSPAVYVRQSSGLAAVFAQEGSRVTRRDGKAFELTLRGDEPLPPPGNGYRLLIEGRFSAFPGGRAIRCHTASVDETPVCVAAAEVDRVAFEDANGKLLKEWRLG